MAEESEKRFHSIMGKLFHSPRQNLTSSPGSQQPLRGKKRGNSMSTLLMAESNSEGVVGGSKRQVVPVGSRQTPLCRPWDRGDLMRRLATFKSMTWFGKPKVVAAVNCARRGWINVEMDIIACESCGVRLLFSTPSSWSQQQVEKAAAVFSLKLDNGHKQLCPWINNACDESLAQFPPIPPPALVDAYEEHSSALLRLSALPMISPSTIDYMRSPQMDCFLEQLSVLECSVGSFHNSSIEYLDNSEPSSARLYFQAQKLISLCGWEPRSLPYAVDCKDQSNQSADDVNLLEPPPGRASGQILSVTTSDEVNKVEENPLIFGGHQSDPDSVVLECRLCGARVGLWAFSKVPRPLEMFRLIGSSEVNGQNESANAAGNDICGASVAPKTHESGSGSHIQSKEMSSTSCDSATTSKERSSSLNLSIAGGPPPTRQNFRATVSLPIISRHLRVGFSSIYDVKDRVLPKMSSMEQENVKSDSQNNDTFQQAEDHNDTLTGQFFQQEDVEASRDDRNGDQTSLSKIDDQSLCLIQGSSEVEGTIDYGNNVEGSLEGRDSVVLGLHAVQAAGISCDSRVEYPVESMDDTPQDSVQNDALLVDAENTRTINAETQVGNIFQVGECCIKAPDASGSIGNGEVNINNVIVAAQGFGKDSKQPQVDEALNFDPVRQHRHFCPWIVSTGSAAPGWQQTLSALDCRKEPSQPLLADSPSFMSEADDPIVSVRKLFMSPSAKRMKTSNESC
ncbi:uncharacterized protein LOC122081613 isoform X2 [Macadamia integrifolia]|uniref:uncharacterized protein LOC122081613 isoform X2 n=1 Tax=Macadamia integrifolia TaxID=60698 RepID=UPI001C4E659E|nr:uncharacterized protein LOC122081613 isoform X2 [Macadamia integrifolia]